MKYSKDWVHKQFDKGETLKYIFFWGHTGKQEVGKHVFSQWYESVFIVDGLAYKTAEHWMMACKAALFGDQKTREKIIQATKPGEVKELGRQIRGFNEVLWNGQKYNIVKTGNIHKFNQNIELRNFLLSTNDRLLVETSPVDNIWGIGLSQDSPMIENPYTWRGENLLGFAIMEARDFLFDFGSFEYNKNGILPPWKKFPDANHLDMFWQMGYGEDYVVEFGKYFSALSDREKKIYELSYPALGDWIGFYKS